MRYSDDIWKGIRMYENHGECSQWAPEAIQRGYGLAYSAAEMRPPIDITQDMVNTLAGEMNE